MCDPALLLDHLADVGLLPAKQAWYADDQQAAAEFGI